MSLATHHACLIFIGDVVEEENVSGFFRGDLADFQEAPRAMIRIDRFPPEDINYGQARCPERYDERLLKLGVGSAYGLRQACP